MAGRVLLDTNIVVAFFAGEPSVCRVLADADEVFVPGVVIGELYYGAFGSIRVDENLGRIEGLVLIATVLPCDGDTAREYGLLKDALRRKGRPLPDNDIWIAAVARQHGLTLVSRDAHFAEFDGLSREAW